jgi:hypothetical protein
MGLAVLVVAVALLLVEEVVNQVALMVLKVLVEDVA